MSDIQGGGSISRPSPLGGGGLGQGGGQEGGGPLEGNSRPSSLTTEPAPLLASPLPQPPPPRGEGSPTRRKKLLALALRVAVSAALIAWIFSRTDFHEVLGAFRSAALWPILVSAVLNPVGYYCSVNRWRLLLRAQGYDVPFNFLLRSFLIGVFFNHLLPGTVGGDAARAWQSSRAGTGKTRALAVVLVDRFLGLLTLMVFAALGLLLSAGEFAGVPGLRVWVALALAGMIAVAALIFVPSPPWLRAPSARVGTFLARCPGQWGIRGRQAWDSLQAFQGKTRVLAAALGWSIGLQTMVVLNGYFLARAVNVHLPLPLFFVIVPVAIFVMMIPVSINAIGVRENVFAFAFAALSVPDAAAAGVAVAWLDYGLLLVQALIGGAVYAFARRSGDFGAAAKAEEAVAR